VIRHDRAKIAVPVNYNLCGGYNYDSTSIRRPFDDYRVIITEGHSDATHQCPLTR